MSTGRLAPWSRCCAMGAERQLIVQRSSSAARARSWRRCARRRKSSTSLTGRAARREFIRRLAREPAERPPSSLSCRAARPVACRTDYVIRAAAPEGVGHARATAQAHTTLARARDSPRPDEARRRAVQPSGRATCLRLWGPCARRTQFHVDATPPFLFLALVDVSAGFHLSSTYLPARPAALSSLASWRGFLRAGRLSSRVLADSRGHHDRLPLEPCAGI